MTKSRALVRLCWVMLAMGYVVLALWLMISPLLWITRDGLGPDAADTTGWAAVRQFSPMLFVGLGVVIYLVLLHIAERRLRRPAPPQ